jgi:cytochrome c oxidase assembly protein subunit 11
VKDSGQNGLLVGKLLLLTIAMFGFGYLLVPLYDVFCEITGLGGRTNSDAAYALPAAVTDRIVEIEFVATVNAGAPWQFSPSVTRMEVHPGAMNKTSFVASNTSDDAIIGQAVPSVAPGQAARYLQKTECFCFNEQHFEAGETKDMPVVFFIDPEIPAHVDKVTLSYTFFAQTKVAAAN